MLGARVMHTHTHTMGAIPLQAPLLLAAPPRDTVCDAAEPSTDAECSKCAAVRTAAMSDR